VRDRRNSGTHKRRPERSAGYGGAARHGAAHRDARRRGHPQSALRRTGDDDEGRGSAAAASRRRASRRDATRRDATTSDRPSVEGFSPRPHVERNTRPSRSTGEVCACSSCRSQHHPAGTAESENTEARRPPLLPSSPQRSSPFASSSSALRSRSASFSSPRHPERCEAF